MSLLDRMGALFNGGRKAAVVTRTDQALPFVADMYTRHAFADRADWESWSAAYNTNPIVQGCVSAYTLNMNEAPLGVLTDEGVEPHQLNEVLTPDVWRLVTNYVTIGGNAYILKLRTNSVIKSVVVYSDKHITPVPDMAGGVAYYSHFVNSTETRIAPSEVIHITGFWVDPDAPWRGKSPVALSSRSVDTYDEATNTIYNVHKNDATPRTVINYDEELSPDQEAVARASFSRRYGGSNRGSVAHMWGIKSIDQLSLSLDELAMESTFGQLEARICGTYRVHPIVAYTFAGINATYANFAEAMKAFTTTSRIPLWVLWAAQVTRQLQVEYPGVTFAFDTSNLAALQPDPNVLATTTVTQFTAGIIDRNEARAVLGYDVEDATDTANEDDEESAPIEARGMVRVRRKELEFSELETLSDVEYWEKADARNTDAARAIANDMRGVFRAMEREALSKIKRYHVNPRVKADPFNVDKWVKRALQATEKNRTELVEDVIVAALKSIGSDVDEYGDAWTATRQDAIDTSSDKIAPSIGTIRDEVRDVLRNNAGASGSELSVILQSYFDTLKESRADAIGRTTATATTGDTQKRVYDEMRSRPNSKKFERVWISYPDARGSDAGDKFNHVNANGQAEDKSGLFTISGERTPYPAGPGLSAGNAVNCRCVTRARRKQV